MSQESGKKPFSLISKKHQLLMYSLFIGFGSVSFYVFITGINTTYLGIVWKYSDSYVINSGMISLISLLASSIFFASCWSIVKEKTVYKYSGMVATLILVIFPFLLFMSGSTMPISFDYVVFLSFPAIALVILIAVFWKKLD
jgi:hypothetical protein